MLQRLVRLSPETGSSAFNPATYPIARWSGTIGFDTIPSRPIMQATALASVRAASFATWMAAPALMSIPRVRIPMPATIRPLAFGVDWAAQAFLRNACVVRCSLPFASGERWRVPRAGRSSGSPGLDGLTRRSGRHRLADL